MYFPKPSLNENDMAIIERGDAAAHSIEAGQYVSWHGKTGKAKAAILQGATLDDTLFDYSENGAINELNASFWKYIDTKTGSVAISYPSTAKRLFIQVTANAILSNEVQLDSLPAGTSSVRDGYYRHGEDRRYYEANINTSTHTVQLSYAESNGSAITGSTVLALYYAN